ncbi:MAG: MerR family transcriptional regulator, partial [Sulfurisoma sp.]|nr:MerR family transcriptional regulator [Sulfurisoma sp.]
GEVAQRVGVSVSALRLYEQRGLIEAGRSEGGTRHFSEEDVERFRAIVGLTRAEVSIDALARLARIRSENRSGDAASRRVEEVLTEVEADLAARLKRLQSARTDLRRAKQRLVGCHDCPKRPTRSNCAGCPVADKLLECQVMRIVWDRAPNVA